MKPPPGLGGAAGAVHSAYSLPSYAHSQRDFLLVDYWLDGEGSDLGGVLFASEDRGRNWRLDRVLTHLSENYVGSQFPCAVVGADLLTVIASDHALTLTAVAPGGAASSVRAAVPPPGLTVLKMSFTDSSHGWVTDLARLLSTSDRGATWVEVTPGRRKSAAAQGYRTPNH